MNIHPDDLADIMFGTRVHPTPLSRVPQDIFAPHIVPHHVADAIIASQSCHFHVIKYPKHAEVWYNKHWNESVSKRAALINSATQHRAEYTNKQKAFDIIVTALRSLGQPSGLAQQIADNIVTNYKAQEPTATNFSEFCKSIKAHEALDLLNK